MMQTISLKKYENALLNLDLIKYTGSMYHKL